MMSPDYVTCVPTETVLRLCSGLHERRADHPRSTPSVCQRTQAKADSVTSPSAPAPIMPRHEASRTYGPDLCRAGDRPPCHVGDHSPVGGTEGRLGSGTSVALQRGGHAAFLENLALQALSERNLHLSILRCGDEAAS